VSTQGESIDSISVLKHFVIETLTGITLFVIIALAASGLSFLVKFLLSMNIDIVIIYGLTAAEYILFAFDLVLFCRFLWTTGCKTWRSL